MPFKIFVLIALVIFQAYDFYKDYKNDYSNKRFGKAFLVLRLVFICLTGYYVVEDFIEGRREKEIVALRGQFGNQKDAISEYPTLRLGGINSTGNVHAVTFGDVVDPINISKEENQIQLNAYIRDSKGDPYATIIGRNWEITNPVGIEYNNDECGLEIMTGGRVIFQLDLVEDTAIVNGMICSQYGNGFFMYNHLTSGFPKLNGTQRFILPADIDITPIFKYPRVSFLGVRAKAN